MKKIIFIFAVAIGVMFAACDKNEIEINNPLQPIDPETLYAKTDFNLDMRDFAMAVNEAINANKSFRDLIKVEVNKKFDGDFNVLLTQIADTKVDNYELNENGTIMRAPGNVLVRDLLNSSFQQVKEKAIDKGNVSLSERYKAPGQSLVDRLTEQYPELQIAVPFLEEQLEDENYIPPVVFLPEEYDETATEFLPIIRKDSIYVIPAKVFPPDSACFVISRNERRSIHEAPNTAPPPAPISLAGQLTDFGIALSWTMPTETTEDNTYGYKIYRKIDNGNYNLIYTNISYNNRSYIDGNLEFNKIYYYYVVAYNDFGASSAAYCNNGVGIVVSTRPNAATAFDVNPIGPNSVRFRWNFGNSDNNGALKLYKRDYYSEEYKNPFYTAQLPVNGDEYVVNNVPKGAQLEYRIERTTPIGTSAPKYDLLYMPYRDVSKKSSVYIKRLKFDNVSKIESWRGAPEYIIKGWRTKKDGTNLTTVEEFSKRIDCTSKKDNTWYNANALVMSDWQPGFDGGTWYDVLTFYAIEYDDDGSWDNIAHSAQSASKIFTAFNAGSSGSGNSGSGSSKVAPAVVAAVIIAVVEVAVNISKWVKSKDEKIGYFYLNYFDKPNKTVTIPAEVGGNLTVEFSDGTNNTY